MIEKNNGNASIGTTNPGSKLHVNGATSIDGNININVSGGYNI